MDEPPEAGAARRVVSLDGLRGLAALVVLVHHALLLSPELAAPYRDPADAPTGIIARLVEYSPLRLAWNGTAAVWIFFVLSGYVLALPAARGRSMNWRLYYPKRLARLYLPVWAAIVLAVGWALLVPRVPAEEGTSWWLAAHGLPGLRGLAHDATLVDGAGNSTSVLWSLQWEVWFSLLLPVYLWAGRLTRRLPPLPVLVVLALVSAVAPSTSWHDAVRYLPMFACGVVLAFAQRPLRVGPWAAVCAAVAINASWYVLGVDPQAAGQVLRAANVVEVVSAAALVAWAAGGLRAAWLGNGVLGWLGSRSFSLYLVHEPVVVSLGILFRPTWWPATALSLPVSLLLAEIFWRTVEGPGMRIAQRLGPRALTRSG